ncbi:MotA/TolQ/ExbB proton channel family protein [Actibacterium atlanticum]|uniref:MotA/TolQ/ExbB proton channel family protein n=1 Tax=Actibacterium atlanticum TaxID=1461693 RepID=A0A058ZP61_9RHOB|nr:hypothetical protein [Actibacterium atlanticum]KCV82952.1 MotA/TolQ/ExbB proton channel family protein [Actibacterium atlanticum]
MGMTDLEAEPKFAQPVRQILTMLIVVGLVGFGAYVALPRVASVFLSNPYLNGAILFVFAIGVLACFWQVVQLISSVNWIEGFTKARPGHEFTHAPRLLAPLAALLRSRDMRLQIPASAASSILDSVATRIEEARDITRYIVNLLIFLGLLGTFYGLATTVPAVVDTIRSLAPSESDTGVQVFDRLMSGLEAQLGGMGTAFSSSLLGLAGSLVVGLLELFAGHGQNRFYRELEEWLSTITTLGYSSSSAEGGDADAMHGVMGQMAARLETLENMVMQAQVASAQADERAVAMATAVEHLAAKLDGGGNSDAALAQIAQGQDRIVAALEGRPDEDAAHVDAESRMRLRSIDVQLLRILEEISAGRQESLGDLRGDLAVLIQVIRDATEVPER